MARYRLINKWWRIGAIFGGIFLIAAAGLGWVYWQIEDEWGTEIVKYDGPPTKAHMGRWLRADYPASLTRVVERSISSKFNGDGEELTIFCFAPADLPEMKKGWGESQTWTRGFPDGTGWRNKILSNAPQDLQIPPQASPDDFIFIEISPYNWMLIDTVHSVGYRGMVWM